MLGGLRGRVMAGLWTSGNRVDSLTMRTCTHTIGEMKAVRRYWGYLGFVILVLAWIGGEVQAIILLGLSIVVILYFLFDVPVWCGAVNRDGTLCRRNSSGLLMGCAFRQHKWQRLKMTVVPHTWREINRGLWASPTTGLATVTALATIVSSLAAVVALVLD